jgi:membrane protease YdiL (CAAX protease family)
LFRAAKGRALGWLVLALLAAGWLSLIGTALRASYRAPVLVPELAVSQRFGLAGLYCEILPAWTRGALTGLSLELEDDPARRLILRGKARTMSADALTGYRLAAQYQSSKSSAALYQVRAEAYLGLRRLFVCANLFLLLAGTAAVMAFSTPRAARPEVEGAIFPSSDLPLALGLLWAWQLALPALSRLLGPSLGQQSPQHAFWLAQILSYLVLWALLLAACRGRLGSLWSLPDPRAAGRGYLWLLLGMPLIDAIVTALTGVRPFTANPALKVLAEATPATVVWLVLWIVVVAPICEETLFRGWMLQGLRRPLGDKAGLLVTSLLFALGHGSFWNVPSLIWGGLVLGWVSLRSGSVTSSMLVHGAWNLTWILRGLASLP